MKEAFEKILERLEEPQFNIGCGACPIKEKCDEVQETIDDEMTDLCAETMRVIAKEIVQEVAEEYDNGWIPCSERLPNVSRCRVTVKYDMEVGNPVYDTLDADFERYQCGYVFKDNCLNDITNSVVAWMPLPEPYKGE